MSHNPAWLVNTHPGDLKGQIKTLVERGYTVTMQDKTTAQLVKKKQFSCLIATLSFLFFGIGFFLYLFYFLAQRDTIVYLDLDTQQPDPHWKDKEKAGRKRFWIGITVIFGFIMFVSVLGALFAPQEPSATTTGINAKPTASEQSAAN